MSVNRYLFTQRGNPTSQVLAGTILTEDSTSTLTHKTIDGDTNTISDLPYDIAVNAGFDATLTKESVAVQIYAKWAMSRAGTVVGEAGYIETAPTDADLIIDVKKNGTSIYTTLPEFAAAAQTLTAGVLKTDGTEEFVSGDRFSVEVTQVGSTEPGEGLLFTLNTKV